jgi:hypothetical protein
MADDFNKRVNIPFAAIDEVSYYLKGDITTLRSFSNKIERNTRDLLNDYEINRIEFEVNKNGRVFIDTTDDEAFECLFKSFEKLKKNIPDKARTAIEQMLNNYKAKKTKCQSGYSKID